MFAASPAFAAGNEAATQASEHWLKLVDTGDFEASWNEAGPEFRNAAAKGQWIEVLNRGRVHEDTPQVVGYFIK